VFIQEMSAQQPGDQQHRQQYVQVPAEAMQQQQVANTLATVPTGGMPAPSSSYPAFDLGKFWTEQMELAATFESDFKNHPLPLARIKKVMKTDQEVKV
jgi:nuclear transcription factor Y gamma